MSFIGSLLFILQQDLIKGKRPFVDSRLRNSSSYIERKLVEIMEHCWKGNRKERPLIHEVVNFLLDVKRNAIQQGELLPSHLINIPMELP